MWVFAAFELLSSSRGWPHTFAGHMCKQWGSQKEISLKLSQLFSLKRATEVLSLTACYLPLSTRVCPTRNQILQSCHAHTYTFGAMSTYILVKWNLCHNNKIYCILHSLLLYFFILDAELSLVSLLSSHLTTQVSEFAGVRLILPLSYNYFDILL